MLFILAMYLSNINKTSMVKYLSFVLIFINFTYVFGQVTYQQYEEEKDLYKKTEIAYTLICDYEMNNLDSSRLLATQLILLGKENGFEYSIAMGEYGVGSYYLRTGKQEKAIPFLKSALVYFKSKEDYKIVSEILNEIGNSYAMNGEYTNAIESYISSMDFGFISNDETAAFNGQIGLAKAYFSLGDTLKGETAMMAYIKSCVKHEKYQSISNAYSYLGMIEQDKGNLNESINLIDKSIYYGLKSDSKLQLSHVYTNKAIIFFSIEEYDSSLIFFEKALELRKELSRPRQICEAYFNLASYYIERGDYSQAIIEIEKSILMAQGNGLLQDEYDGVELLEFIYDEIGDDKAKEEQSALLGELSFKMEDKKRLNKDLVSYIDEIESSLPSEGSAKKENVENKSWMLIAGGVIIILAGGVLGRSIIKMNVSK